MSLIYTMSKYCRNRSKTSDGPSTKGEIFASLWGGGERWLSKGKFPRCHNFEITLKHHVGVSLLIRKLYLLTGKGKKFLLLTKKALESL